jgi:putative ABC transport system ATP-binding protein
MPVITLEQVSKFWMAGQKRIDILKNVDLSVYQGESLAITGPSGAGKSTLLHVLGLLTPVNSGLVTFLGCKLNTYDRGGILNFRRQIGLVFQDAKLLPDHSVVENVCLPLNHRGIWPARQRRLAIEALDWVGLKERLSHHPNELSGGEIIRVAIARALVQRPTLLLADEPTGSLDSQTGKIIADLIFATVSAETALVLVTHQREVAQRAERIIEMKDGHLETAQ